jgi:predicted AAA+ superfamily ATPase
LWWRDPNGVANRFAKTVVELQKPSTFKAYKLYADTGDRELLSGEKPLMFDEWQKIPDLWDYIRAEIDETSACGSFILTGSVKPIENNSRHTGIGRMK